MLTLILKSRYKITRSIYTDLEEPTRVDCDRDDTYRVATIAVSSVVVTLMISIVMLSFTFCSYKCFKVHQRTVRRKNIPKEERERLEKQNIKLVGMLHDPLLTDSNMKEILRYVREILETNRKLLMGDGTDVTEL